MSTSGIRRSLKETYKIKKSESRFFCEVCGDELADLASCCNADEIFNIYLLGDGSMQSEQVDAIYATEGEEMLCPYCDGTLGPWNEDVAREILKSNNKKGGRYAAKNQ